MRPYHTWVGFSAPDSWWNLSLTAPICFALLQIGLNSFREIGATVDAGYHIVEIDSLFCCIQTSLCLFRSPDRKGCKRTDLLGDFGCMCHELLCIDNRRKKTTLQSLVCRKQARCKKHLLRFHRAKRIYQVQVIFEGDTIA